MEQKIFLLIAIFCIALVKSNEEESDEYEYKETDNTDYTLPEYPSETGVGYPGFFPKYVLLTDAISPWGNEEPMPKCFQEQYKNGSDFYKQAIDEFSEELLQAVSETLDKVKEGLGSESECETLYQNISTSANELGVLLKEYQVKFSGLVDEGSFEKIKALHKEYDDKIQKKEMALNEDITALKGKTSSNNDLFTTMKDLESTRNKKLTILTDSGEQVMELLKKCLEEKNRKN